MLKLNFLFQLLSLILITITSISADTPANCTYEDVTGLWVFHEGPRGNDNSIQCTDKVNITSALFVQLSFPNIATDDNGNVGFWTIIYNQGFEVVINNRKYFAFFYYTQNGDNVTSYCFHTFWGWAHGTGVNPSDWSCHIATRADNQNVTKSYSLKRINKLQSQLFEEKLYEKNLEYIDQINRVQSSWKATHYDFMSKMKISDLIKMAGGTKSYIAQKPRATKPTEAQIKEVACLPDSFDWRNVSGVNYVSPVRNQGSCGSCYAYSSLAMNEARLRIKTLNQQQKVFSTQDIVECAQYSQGCEGGFPYLISGKYAEDFGLVEESCNPYKGQDGTCTTPKSCKRSYSTNYHYVGGFYGACNEALMRVELVKNGPLAIAFEVYDDFFGYKGGVYHHTFVKDIKNFKFNPFQLTNHAVLLVGYGVENDEPYWIVKNSWGTEWGENGFFRIRRGTDECAIESIAVGSDIVV